MIIYTLSYKAHFVRVLVLAAPLAEPNSNFQRPAVYIQNAVDRNIAYRQMFICARFLFTLRSVAIRLYSFEAALARHKSPVFDIHVSLLFRMLCFHPTLGRKLRTRGTPKSSGSPARSACPRCANSLFDGKSGQRKGGDNSTSTGESVANASWADQIQDAQNALRLEMLQVKMLIICSPGNERRHSTVVSAASRTWYAFFEYVLQRYPPPVQSSLRRRKGVVRALLANIRFPPCSSFNAFSVSLTMIFFQPIEEGIIPVQPNLRARRIL